MYSFDRQRREYQVFTTLLQMIPGLEDRLVEGSEEGVIQIADLVSLVLLSKQQFVMIYVEKDSEGCLRCEVR
jgi:hypothetical protein